MLTEEVLLPPVLALLPSPALLRVAAACRQQLEAVAACEGVWAQRVLGDFGGSLERAYAWTGLARGGARELHRRLTQLRRAFDDAVVAQGDLCAFPLACDDRVDAVVCPSVPTCGPYGPCAVAVHRAAGPALEAFLQSHALPAVGGRVRVGQAIVTPAFEFPGVRAIVHAVGPTWQFEAEAQRVLLRQAYESAFRALRCEPDGPARCVATASISTGGNGMSVEVAAPIALAACRDAVCFGGLERLYIVLFEGYSHRAFEAVKRAVLSRFNEDPAIPDED